MAQADFDFAELLEWRKAHFNEEISVGLTTDGDLIVQWSNIPKGAMEGAVDYVYANYRTVATPTVDHKIFDGTWRLVDIKTQRRRAKDRGVERDEDYDADAIVVTFRYGWITTLVTGGNVIYGEARLVNKKRLPGNDSTTDAGADSTSDDPERYLLIEWPNCSADHDASILAELSEVEYTDPAADGQTHSGTYHKVYATSERVDDKSTTIRILLAQPQYTLNAFEAWNTAWAKDRTYLWNVPKDLAQNILDAFKEHSDGRSATCSYSTDHGLVNIVLMSPAVTKSNLTTDSIDITCDTAVVYHFAWGYTKDELNAFLQDHDDAIPGVADANEGMTRKIDIQHRGDGLFDAIVEERTFGPHSAPATPDFTITVPTGTTIDSVQSYGWNLRHSELASVKAVYDINVQDIGTTCTFKITREGDCSFDYVGTITTVTAITKTAEITIASDGTGLKVEAGKNVLDADLTAIDSDYTSAARKRFSIILDPNADETSNYKVVQETVQEVQETLASSGTGVDVSLKAGRNVDTTSLAALTITSVPRTRIAIDMSGQDDGTVNYSVREVTVLETQVDKTTDANGIKEKVYGAANVDEANLPILASEKRVRPNWIRFEVNDDSTISYVAKETTVQDPTGTGAVGQKYLDIDFSLAHNADAIPTLTQPTTVGQEVTFQARYHDDGTTTYEQRTIQKAEVSTDVASGSMVRTITLTDAKNDITGGPADVTAALATSTYFEQTVHADGAVDYVKTQIASVERLSTDDVGSRGSNVITLSKLVPKATSHGYEDTAVVFRNVYVDHIPDVANNPTGYGYLQQLTMEDDFTFSGIAIYRDYLGWVGGGGVDLTIEDLTIDDSTEWILTQRITDVAGNRYKDVIYVVEEWWEDDYATAASRMQRVSTGAPTDDDAMEGSTLSKEQVNGQWYWHVVRLHPPTYGSWTTLGS